MTTPQMDWLDDERRRGRNATPWLPPLSCDPRLVTVPRVGGLVTHRLRQEVRTLRSKATQKAVLDQIADHFKAVDNDHAG